MKTLESIMDMKVRVEHHMENLNPSRSLAEALQYHQSKTWVECLSWVTTEDPKTEEEELQSSIFVQRKD